MSLLFGSDLIRTLGGVAFILRLIRTSPETRLPCSTEGIPLKTSTSSISSVEIPRISTPEPILNTPPERRWLSADHTLLE